eukprot:3054507-Prymnesium_polylepis.2
MRKRRKGNVHRRRSSTVVSLDCVAVGCGVLLGAVSGHGLYKYRWGRACIKVAITVALPTATDQEYS